MPVLRLIEHLRQSRRDRLILYLVMLFFLLTVYEWRTSVFQSVVYAHYARKLHYSLGDGPSSSIVFPEEGPFDQRRGYVRIPAFVRNLERYQYEVTRQARFTPELLRAAREGISPPYGEKPAAGLTILDSRNNIVHESVPREKIYSRFEDIPGDVIRTLLFIENRELLTPSYENQNPVLEWDRLAKAGIQYIGRSIGISSAVEGGSTLATQLEKYQHSGGGRTRGAQEKIRQITSASLRAYRAGRSTTVSRREIITDYVNTVPLASVAGYGEVHGLGEGLWAWFGDDIRMISETLRDWDTSLEKQYRRAEAFKKVMALFLAVKAPTQYLVKNRPALLKRIAHFADLMEDEGEITKEFRDLLKAAPLLFRTGPVTMPPRPAPQRKGSDMIRNYLLKVLDLPGFYDLDRLDLTVQSTLDSDLQRQVTDMLVRLGERGYVKAAALDRERMLDRGDPGELIYSFTLYEKTTSGNMLRVQADNLDKPLSVNEGVKLDLGSTAKLRTLAHYLQVVTAVYEEALRQGLAPLESHPGTSNDPITAWVKAQVRARPEISLGHVLEAAMERKFSASPNEVFFTGGGEHRFHNFSSFDDNRTVTLYEGMSRSVNLVFVRLMREIVQYHMARLDFDTKAVLEDEGHPRRRELLKEVADSESRRFLDRFAKKYRGLSPDQAMEKLLGDRRTSPRHLAILFYALHPSGSPEELVAWLRQRKPGLSELGGREAAVLAKQYGKPGLTLSDCGYILSRHPLELWTMGYLESHPDAS
ncbi:MAG: transglycosylase domain-containing protein, partial [Nitrospiraceae bacterium]